VSVTSRRSGASNTEAVLLWAGISLVVLVVGGVNLVTRVGWWITPGGPALPGNPVALLLGVIQGAVPWPPRALALGIGLAALLLGAGGLLLTMWARRGQKPSVDRAGAHLGRGKDLRALSRKGATATARRLGVDGYVGQPLGVTVAGGQPLYAGVEDVALLVAGPRTVKSSAYGIPWVLNAPGWVVATSNKRDLCDATRDPRGEHGHVWVFDPQGIAGEQPTWWWDPLSYVTDEVQAQKLARLWATSSRDVGARTDAYFDNAAMELLGNLLLACAVAQRPITQVYLWLTTPADDEPAVILRKSGQGYTLQAAALEGMVNLNPKQRDGVYGGAKGMCSFLTSRAAARWVTPAAGDRRRQFSPARFVRSADTLHLLSREGEGSTGPLVTALTVSITEAAEAYAKESPGGRLPIPGVCVLDEAANVCRWKDLPDMYSHYGSRGILILTILQSYSQGVEVWGRDGMRKLLSAANVLIYGGGVRETEWLQELSQLLPEWRPTTVSTSYAKGQRTTSRSTHAERLLDVQELSSLAKGRALVFSSGAPPTLVRTVPWMDGPHADAVRASQAAHDPAGGARPPAVKHEPDVPPVAEVRARSPWVTP